jgi:hypothetical protein
MLFHCGTLDRNPCPRNRPNACRDLAIYLLTPGFSKAYQKQVLGVSSTTITKYMQWSLDQAEHDPTILDRVPDNAASITAEDGLMMAQRRGGAHLTWWSRLALAEYMQRLGSTDEVAALFNCSRRTVQHALKAYPIAYELLSGKRVLSWTQASPPGKWTSNRQA